MFFATELQTDSWQLQTGKKLDAPEFHSGGIKNICKIEYGLIWISYILITMKSFKQYTPTIIEFIRTRC